MRHHVDPPAGLPAIFDRVNAACGRRGARRAIAIADAGVRYEEIDRPHLLLDGTDQVSHLLLVADVDLPPAPADLAGDGLGRLFIEIRNRDGNIFPVQTPTDRPADAVAAASDDRNPDVVSHRLFVIIDLLDCCRQYIDFAGSLNSLGYNSRDSENRPPAQPQTGTKRTGE